MGKRLFKFIEDIQIGSTLLYAIDDYGDQIGIVSLKGRPLKLEEYYFDACEFQDVLFG